MAMTFLAPVPWEADAFYAQPGFGEVGLTLDTWPVGTGPYMMTEFIKDRRHVMKRNPNYRGEPYPCEGSPGDKEAGLLDDCGKPTPFIDTIVSTIERESVPQRGKFRQGFYDIEVFERNDTGLDYLIAMQDSEAVRAEYLNKGFRLPKYADVSSWLIGFNMLDPQIGYGTTPEQQVRNRKLRQAISMAIDWEEYSKIFPKKGGETAMSPLPDGIFGSKHNSLDGVNPVTHKVVDGKVVRRSIAEAKKLLAEARRRHRQAAGHQLRLLRTRHARAQARHRLGGSPVRQDRHSNRGARHRQQPVPRQNSQRQLPSVLAGLVGRLP